MDSHSFLFVVCVNDEPLYSRCKSHIMQLTVPLHTPLISCRYTIQQAWPRPTTKR